MATTQQQALTTLGTEPITAEQLLKMDAKGKRGELIRGVFSPTMSAGTRHGKISMRLGRLLGNVAEQTGAGTIVGTDSGVLINRDPDTVLEPDVAFFSKDTLPLDADVPGYAEVIPELVVEVVSPSDTVREIAGKTSMWITAGVQLVWVLWPETRMIEIHRPAQPVTTLRETDTLTGEEILPQFTVPVKDIFDA